MGITGVSLRISGGEDGVDENEGADDLSAESSAFVVAGLDEVGATAVPVVVCLLEALGESCTADCTCTLCYHV